MKSIKKILSNSNTFLVLVILIPLIVSLQNYLQGVNHFWGSDYTYYNNYVIFKNSFTHLIENKNLYELHLNEYADLFKYTPTFALFMGVFAYLPDLPGLLLWNTLNCLVFYFALTSLSKNETQKLAFLLGFTVLELILTTQSSQSNALIAGLLILSFTSMEKNKMGTAAFLIVTAAFIKIFSLFAVLLFVLYPGKIRAFAYLVFWILLFGLAPLVLISPENLSVQYNNWISMLTNDHSASLGMSVFTVVSVIFGNVNKIGILITGIVLILFPLLHFKSFINVVFRLWYLAAILIWMVIFNHKGESPTYIIAMTGCAIWGAYSERTKGINFVLVVTWVLTSLIKTDLVPRVAKDVINLNFINTIMPTIIFLILIYSLLRHSKTTVVEPDSL